MKQPTQRDIQAETRRDQLLLFQLDEVVGQDKVQGEP
jgi:hypothetical protein